jgi:hypothetical protein
MIKNNNLVNFSPGGYQNDLGGFHELASELKKASKYQLLDGCKLSEVKNLNASP